MKPKADYGIDAPGVIRNIIVIGILCLGIPPVLHLLVKGRFDPGWILLMIVAAVVGVCLIATGLMLIFSSKVGKIKERERILDLLKLTGRENILDVGCGKGLYLVGVAKRLSTGTATGIDIWQSKDLSGNHQDNTIRNADIESVSKKIQLKTANMKEMPFQNETFDLILSSFAIHNIYQKSDRRQALLEMVRVLKAGGKLCIIDLLHSDEYISVFIENGITGIKKFKTRLIFPVATVIIGIKDSYNSN